MRAFIYHNFKKKYIFSLKCYKHRFYFWFNTSGKLKKQSSAFCAFTVHFVSPSCYILNIFSIQKQFLSNHKCRKFTPCCCLHQWKQRQEEVIAACRTVFKIITKNTGILFFHTQNKEKLVLVLVLQTLSVFNLKINFF